MWNESSVNLSLLFSALAREQRLGTVVRGSGVHGREAQRPQLRGKNRDSADGSDFQTIFRQALKGDGP
ncbi:MAG: hypothetical protein HQL82_03040 [Magnetococcales bacterium]|nr:hypothetical protein [Magnetococcales bacterium]